MGYPNVNVLLVAINHVSHIGIWHVVKYQQQLHIRLLKEFKHCWCYWCCSNVS